MRLIFLLMMTTLIASCSSLPVETAGVCEASEPDRAAHAAALLDDGGPRSKRTGAVLLSGLQGACGG
jgi:hypothetical protein